MVFYFRPRGWVEGKDDYIIYMVRACARIWAYLLVVDVGVWSNELNVVDLVERRESWEFVICLGSPRSAP